MEAAEAVLFLLLPIVLLRLAIVIYNGHVILIPSTKTRPNTLSPPFLNLQRRALDPGPGQSNHYESRRTRSSSSKTQPVPPRSPAPPTLLPTPEKIKHAHPNTPSAPPNLLKNLVKHGVPSSNPALSAEKPTELPKHTLSVRKKLT
ncbi:hypothetical protein PtA15_4A608 [Puccinia triticina]|uniref:Uncharacterized protein n=1 Tax=Puccinia triticina TaxID=208348 RepID=A0ABY7CG03_9BASI|nr:uncharacterized protein PtA15_4A608 [Puccinia triticina]WAQ84156.1 hypothetical protein PtA15_4A608 [Puccinia triticina]